MDLADTASTLYVLPLDRFTQERNAAAKNAATNGDKDLAAALRALPKPSSAAWLVNVLVDRRRSAVEQILELGASLGEAQASLDRAQLHALGQQRQRLLSAVARQSLDAASEVGHDVGPAALPGVEQTLRAALADPAAATAVLTGRLVRTLEATGWDPVDLDGAVAGPFTPPPVENDDPAGTDQDDETATATATATKQHSTQAPKQASARQRKDAEARMVEARAALTAAEDAATKVRQKAERLRVRRDGLTASIEDLEERLEVLRSELADLDAETEAVSREAAESEHGIVEATKAEEAARHHPHAAEEGRDTRRQRRDCPAGR